MVPNISELYPPPPEVIPEDLAKPSQAYGLRIVFLLVGLFGFLLFYLALIFLTGWAFFQVLPLVQHIVNVPKGGGNNGKAVVWGVILWAMSLVAIGMLFLFFFKGLFKGRRSDRSHYLELTRKDQPVLFQFIEKICEETSAPRPNKVYMSPDVNAAVIYNTSLLNLIIPPKKDLLIGAGLVEVLNLREFKAVLAHEFGHFSQKSLAIGNYVYVVNQIMGDMIYSRDKWDDLLKEWCRWDIRFSFPAWVLRGIIWVLRKIMGGIYRGINLLDMSLSRQMEFNADDFAVKAAGSDAIVHSLSRLDFASESQGEAMRSLSTATDHGLFTRDLFFHQTKMADHLRKVRKDPKLGTPPVPEDGVGNSANFRVFDPEKDGPSSSTMWSTHPPKHQREANAKRYFVSATQDDRSAWLIFQDLDELKKQITTLFYKNYLEKESKKDLEDPQKVQEFIDAEIAETTYDPRYGEIYDTRWIALDKWSEWMEAAKGDSWPTARLKDFLLSYPSEAFKELNTQRNSLLGEDDLLRGLIHNKYQLKAKTLEFRKEQVKPREFPKLLEKVEKEFETIEAQMGNWDKDVYLAHHFAAVQLDGARAADLDNRYQFHGKMQEMAKTMKGWMGAVEHALNFLQEKELTSEQFQEVKNIFNETIQAFHKIYTESHSFKCPSMSHVEEGASLGNLIWEEGVEIPKTIRSDSSISGNLIGQVCTLLQKTIARMERIHFKSLGMILSRQEGIVRDWLNRSTNEQVEIATEGVVVID